MEIISIQRVTANEDIEWSWSLAMDAGHNTGFIIL